MRTLFIMLIVYGLFPLTAFSSSNSSSTNPSHFSNTLESKSLIVLVKRYRSGFPRKRPATGRRVFIFSPRLLRWAAYDANGRLVRTGRASGGRGYCRDIGRSWRTPRGVFRVKSKGSKYCRSSRYPRPRGGAPMPYCTFFYGHYAIHGSPDVPNYNASHGCIRVKPHAAAWLSGFLRIGTTVIVRPY